MTVLNLLETENDHVDHFKLSMEEKIRRAVINQKNRDKQLAGLRQLNGNREVRPSVDETDIEEFLDAAVTNKEDAVEFLILNSILSENQHKSVSFQLLSSLTYCTELSTVSDDQRIAVIEAVADATDEMAKLSGSFNVSSYNIFFMSESISKKFLRSLPLDSRMRVLMKILKEGKAYSWLVFFARVVIRDHQIGDTSFAKFVPWLEENEIEIVKETTIQRLGTIMRKHYDSVSDPFQLHLFWLQHGSDEDREWLKKWVEEKTKKDERFVDFVENFTGRAVLSTGKYIPDSVQIAYLETLGSLVEIKTLVQRLKKITQKESVYRERSEKLLQTVLFTLSAKERGLRIISKYR